MPSEFDAAAARTLADRYKFDSSDRATLASVLTMALDEIARLQTQLAACRREIKEAERDAASEERWKHIQGDDYGGY